jgi:TPP-dependent pyruvate/acetoin dehydrogenase alpha subunit
MIRRIAPMEINMEPSKKQMVDLLKTMVTIRLFEGRLVDLYAMGFTGLTHLYIGQEAIAAGVCANLRKEDYITSTHRGHGHVIAKGGALKFMMAELFGKKTGYCKGKGGSMHIADINLGILGANGIVGGGIPIAVGAALSSKMRKTDQVTVCFFGDDASNTGAFHEGLNLASIHCLPVVFICENNLYGISVPQKQHQAIQDISIRAVAYNMPGVTVDGNDVLAVHKASGKAIERARAGKGPTLIECKTYRWRGHHEGDPNRGSRYRPVEEVKEWMKKCPIRRFEEKLLGKKIVTTAKGKKIREEIEKEIDEAIAFAKESPYPDPQDLYEDVYTE